MSADLLRRASKKLRDEVGGLLPEWRSEPWRVVLTDSESLTGVAACSYHGHAEADEACDSCGHFETYMESAAQYVALMHPPVALALAEWIDSHAHDMESSNDHLAFCDSPGDVGRALVVAREVLREPS